MDRTFRVVLALVCLYSVSLVTCYTSDACGIRRHNVEAAFFIFAAIAIISVAAAGAGAVRTPPSTGGLRQASILAGLAGLLMFWRAFEVGLLSDDYVLRNWILAGHLDWVAPGFARPVAQALWRTVFALGGGAKSLHLLNISLHILNSLLCWRLATALGLSRASAFIACLIFLIWPTQVEPVVWAAGIFDVLSTFFMLAVLLVAVTDRPTLPRAAEVLLVAALTLLALFTKESAVALPGLFLLTLGAPARREPALVRNGLLFGTVVTCTVAYFAWRFWSDLPLESGAVLSRYVLKEQVSRTIGSLALPLSEPTIRSHPWFAAAVAAFVPVFLTACSWRRGGRHGPVLSLRGAAWCIIAASPTVGLLYIGSFLDGSRYLYCAAAGWGLVVGGLFDGVRDSPVLRRVAIVWMLAAVIGIVREQQLRIGDWRTAASQRDHILAQAVSLAEREGCRTVTVSGLPSRFQGAQLFNNGFIEALADWRANVAGTRECNWRWTGSAFEPGQ